MARLKPRQNLIDLKNQFSQKNSIAEFKKLHKRLKKEMHNYSNPEKLKGGEYETMISEISTLSCIIDKYKPSNIKYTGGANSSKDGILYFNEGEQYVEIVGMVDEQEMKAMRKPGVISLATLPSLVEVMEDSKKKGLNLPEELARKMLESQATSINEAYSKEIKAGKWLPAEIPEDFFYRKIVSVLKKKNQKKYENFWLLISYSPFFQKSDFGKENVRDFVLQKIQSQEEKLFSEVKKIFKKIIFIPFDKGQANHKIFEWQL